MSVLDSMVSGLHAPEGLDARDLPGGLGSSLDAVLSSIGVVFPEPLFIVDEADTLVWMNLAMADRICRDNALEPDYAVEWLLSQIDDQEDDLVRDGLGAGDSGAVRVVALLDVLGRPEWLTVRICELPSDGQTFRMVVLQDITSIKRETLALREENATLQHSLRQDLATGLPSRSALRDGLAAVRDDQEKSMIVLEITDFRAQTAQHGSNSINRVLERFAADLADMVDDNAIVARVAEDRFAILGEATDAETLQEQASMIARAIASDHQFPTGRWSLRLRAACATGAPRGPGQLDLLRRAEAALVFMPSPTAATPFQIRFDNGELLAKRRRDAVLQAGLEGAIFGGQLEAFLQPVITASEGRVAFVEALVRWRHPESGLIPPPFFLQIAREADLICAVDLATSRSACQAMAQWQGAFGPLPVSLNLSQETLRDPDTCAALVELIAESGLRPTDVVFECSRLPLDAASDGDLLSGIAHLRGAGLQLALEDAGRLHTDPLELFRYTPDFVKIGPDCIDVLTTPDDADGAPGAEQQALRAYLDTALQLGCDLVAVGVQEPSQPTRLTAAGLTLLQGHLVGRPMAPARFGTWLETCDRTKDGLPCRRLPSFQENPA